MSVKTRTIKRGLFCLFFLALSGLLIYLLGKTYANGVESFGAWQSVTGSTVFGFNMVLVLAVVWGGMAWGLLSELLDAWHRKRRCRREQDPRDQQKGP